MIKTVLLTGGNSMLGINTALALLRKGYRVRTLVRTSRPELSDCEIVYGNITSYQDVYAASEDCDAIVHIAAATGQDLLRLADYTNINVVATENVCRASLATTAKRVIFVSTANTIGNGTNEHLATENMPASKPFRDNLYAKSKILAEQKALESGANVLIINPTFMIGEYDSKPSSGKIITMNYGKKIIFAPKGGKNFVAASDVAQAIVNALPLTITREKILTGGENYSFKQFYQRVASTQNHTVKIIEIPSCILYFIGAIGSGLRFCGIKTPVSLTNMQILATQEYYSSAKAREELTMPQTPLNEAITSCINWFKSAKMLPQ